MSRQFDELVTQNSVILYGEDMRRFIEPKTPSELVAAIELKNEIECCIYATEDNEEKIILEEALSRQSENIVDYVNSLGEFDNSIFVNNISYLTSKTGIKIGTLENILGISAGYISRTANENSKKNMSIDIAWKISKFFGVDLCTLISIPLDGLNDAEKYYSTFISKLISDTMENKLEWAKEKADTLNSLQPGRMNIVPHQMFSCETFYRDTPSDYPEQVTEPVFQSDSFGFNTYICGNCYNLRLKNLNYIFLMSVSKASYSIGDDEIYAKELWLVDAEGNRQIICRNNDGTYIASLVDRLYEVLEEMLTHPRVDGNVKKVIDAFMIDDFTDDPDEYPF